VNPWDSLRDPASRDDLTGSERFEQEINSPIRNLKIAEMAEMRSNPATLLRYLLSSFNYMSAKICWTGLDQCVR
jgi:hypothetical protein